MTTSLPLLLLGPPSAEVAYVVQLSVYPSGQPKLLLARYGAIEPKTVLTLECRYIDLKSYDADFAMKRQHAIVRCSGNMGPIFGKMVKDGFIKPTPDLFKDGPISACISQINPTFCIPFPSADEA